MAERVPALIPCALVKSRQRQQQPAFLPGKAEQVVSLKEIIRKQFAAGSPFLRSNAASKTTS
ncbi:MAG: hypothetical protein HY525_17585 [Betaproteobacteria bacterium]|nr:hypothetical protein [Betaproteobacteria bacterium]